MKHLEFSNNWPILISLNKRYISSEIRMKLWIMSQRLPTHEASWLAGLYSPIALARWANDHFSRNCGPLTKCKLALLVLQTEIIPVEVGSCPLASVEDEEEHIWITQRPWDPEVCFWKLSIWYSLWTMAIWYLRSRHNKSYLKLAIIKWLISVVDLGFNHSAANKKHED